MARESGGIYPPSTGEAYPPSSVVGDFDLREYPLDTSGSPVRLFGHDSNRFSIFLPNVPSGFMYEWAFHEWESGDPINEMNRESGALVLTFRDLGPLVTQPLWTSFSGFGGTPIVYTVSYRPER